MTISTRRNAAVTGAVCSLLIAGALIGCRGGGKSAADKTATSVAGPGATRTAVSLKTAYPKGTPKPGSAVSGATGTRTVLNGPDTGPGSGSPQATLPAGSTPGTQATPGPGEPTLPPGTTATPGAPATEGPPPTPVVLPGGKLGVAIDADTSSPTTVEGSAHRAVGSTFTVGINFVPTDDQPEFAGFDLEISSDNTSVLTVDATESGLQSSAGVPWGCGPAHFVATGPEGSTHITCIVNSDTVLYTGQGMVLNVTCASAGTAHVHLVRGTASSTGENSSIEDDTFGTSFLSDPGTFVPTSLVDAEIVCE